MEIVSERHIVQEEDIRSNKPHLVGTRITVSDIVMWHFRLGISLEEIAEKYDLSLAAVYAAVSYYYDHKSEIDREIETSRAYYDKQKQQSTSLVAQKLNFTQDE